LQHVNVGSRGLPAVKLDREQFAIAADGLAAAAAASLPWSTSATGILLALWLAALLPTLDVAAVRRELVTFGGGAPVALWLLGGIGMAWADVPILERLGGWGAFHKLLAIPLLLAQFRRSDNSGWVMKAYLASSALLLLASGLDALGLFYWKAPYATGVGAKDWITQAGTFEICIFALVYATAAAWAAGHRMIALALAGLAIGFLGDIVFIITSRTALAVIPILMVVLATRHFGLKGVVGIVAVGAVLWGALWVCSPYLRTRVEAIGDEVSLYRTTDTQTSSGLRLEFWGKSLGFVREAPLFGHGTGTIKALFARVANAGRGASSVISTNPHQQILAVAIQLGMVGVAVLLALWIAHLLMFWGPGFAAWCGLVIVVQNLISSQFNSHLFDFTQGWMYVLGVGVFGGMVSRARSQNGHNCDCAPSAA
jgi:O-antigen ligase